MYGIANKFHDRAIEPNAVQTCGGMSPIFGEGGVTLKIDNMHVKITRKEAPDFSEKSSHCQDLSIPSTGSSFLT